MFCGNQFNEPQLQLAKNQHHERENRVQIAKEYFMGRFSVLLLFILAAFVVFSRYYHQLVGLFTLIIVLPVLFLGYVIMMRRTRKKFSIPNIPNIF